MVDITVVELHIEEGSLSANLPFSGRREREREAETGQDDEAETDRDEDAAADDSTDRRRGLALLGVLAFLVVATATVRYLSGERDQPDVPIEAADESQPVTAE